MSKQTQNNIQHKNETNIASQYEININDQQNQNQQIQVEEGFSVEQISSIMNTIANVFNNRNQHYQEEEAMLREALRRNQFETLDDNENQRLYQQIEEMENFINTLNNNIDNNN